MTTRLTRITLLGVCALSGACSKDDTPLIQPPRPTARRRPPQRPLRRRLPRSAQRRQHRGHSRRGERGDSAGNMASTKGTNAEVKGFGRDMMRDHHALRKAGQDLAKKLNLTPATPRGRYVPAPRRMAEQHELDAQGRRIGTRRTSTMKRCPPDRAPTLQAALAPRRILRSKR